MKVLVTGFEPFNQMKHNPSEMLVSLLKEFEFKFSLEGLVLPVSFERSFLVLEEALLSLVPDVVVSLGVAQKRQAITPEKMAINHIETKIADNDGHLPEESEVLKGYPDELISDLPVEEMVKACVSKNIPAKVSFSAGSYVCNQVMYKTLCLSKLKSFRSGFIHLPPLEVMPIEITCLGLRSMLEVLEGLA